MPMYPCIVFTTNIFFDCIHATFVDELLVTFLNPRMLFDFLTIKMKFHLEEKTNRIII